MENDKKKRRNTLIVFVIIVIMAHYPGFLSAQVDYTYPLKLTEGSRFLTDQDGRPFFWSGEAAWSLIVQLSRDEVDYYLNDRKQKGFTLLLVNLIDHKFGSKKIKFSRLSKVFVKLTHDICLLHTINRNFLPLSHGKMRTGWSLTMFIHIVKHFMSCAKMLMIESLLCHIL